MGMKFETPDEEILDSLGSRSFLRFWSYSNIFRDQGKTTVNGDGKELCDFVVVFGNTVLLFSDKRIEYPDAENDTVAWKRWHRKAITASARQLKGAARWLTNYPSRVYIDKACTKPLPISIQTNLNIHKIVVTHGAEPLLGNQHGEESFSFVNDDPGLYEVNQRDLHGGDFYHVFTGESLAFVLGEINTLVDFLEYLTKRRSVFDSGNKLRISKESDFVHGFYKASSPMATMPLIEEFAEQSDVPVVVRLPGISNLLNDPIYKQRKRDDVVSFVWDHLIEHLSMHVAGRTTIASTTSGIEEDEEMLRTMANTSRLERRTMSQAVFEMWCKVQPNSRGSRFYFNQRSSVCYVFLFCFPNDGSCDSEEQYRQLRQDLLTDYMQIYGHENPEYLTIMGLAFSSRTDDNIELAQFHRTIDNGGVDFAMFDNIELDTDHVHALERVKLELIERGLFTEERTPKYEHHQLFERATK